MPVGARGRRPVDGAKTVHFAQSARMSTYITALCAGPYHEVRDDARRHRPGRLLPRLDGAVPRRRRPVPDHQAGLRLLPRAVRRALPAAQVRPAVGARLQRRRDGELRLRHARRGALHLPLAGHRLRVRAARQHDPARAGPHVVRRPGHHALVERPVAERVVRRVGQPLVQHPRHPVHRRLDDVPVDPQELGLPAGPALLHPPGLLRDARPGGGRGQLRRHHVRQGRQRHQAARRVRRAGAVPGRAARLLRARTPGATPPSTTCSASWRRRPAASCASSPRSGWRPRRSTRCARWSTIGADGTYASGGRAAGGAGRLPDAAHPPDRRRPLRPADGDRLVRRDLLEIDVTGERTEIAGAGRRARRPTCCCSTTTT